MTSHHEEETTPAAAGGASSSSSYEYVFGFGSIINTDTHGPWLKKGGGSGGGGPRGEDDDDGDDGCDDDGGSGVLPGRQARLLPSFGYRRSWNFRSRTGFTALGISRAEEEEGGGGNGDDSDENDDRGRGRQGRGRGGKGQGGSGELINGIIFRLRPSQFVDFDRREVGYDRVLVRREDYELLPIDHYGRCSKPDSSLFDSIDETDRVWVYVPRPSQTSPADESHPLLQSYVDTVMQGCIEWGGEAMASEFVETTSGWSPFFLNDTPSSRRPWLFRREYETIDRVLRTSRVNTHFEDRRHPEEFASAFLIKMMRGTWSVPRRNEVFTGRDEELGRIHARLTDSGAGGGLGGGGVTRLEVSGMGGVGKTQLCTEYCYRHFPSYYGLVIWLNAEGAEALAASYRQLMADTTDVDVKDKDADEVIGEVKARLFRSKVPWLLVFDNLEDRALLEKFLPHGSVGTRGHVLVTTRHVDASLDISRGDGGGIDGGCRSTLVLNCFSPSESVELLRLSAGTRNVTGSGGGSAAIEEGKTRAALEELAARLGHLPLALGMAAAYMRGCDVHCTEYLEKYVRSSSESGGGGISASAGYRSGKDGGSGGGGGGSVLLGHRAGRLSEYPLGVRATRRGRAEATILAGPRSEEGDPSSGVPRGCWRCSSREQNHLGDFGFDGSGGDVGGTR